MSFKRNKSQISGELIHKILEIFGKNSRQEKSWLESLAQKIIAAEEDLDEAKKAEVVLMVNNFLLSDCFEELFSGSAKFEVPLIGESDGKKIIARIDLLIERPEEILIVDYKSGKPLKEIPQSYKNQLNQYRQILINIYPGRKISCAILWLENLLMSKF
jgi:ATP-dependent helicase/nuclease subunit A